MRNARHVLIVLPRAVHLMDVAGPAQVFTNATEAGARYTLGYVAATPTIASHQGLPLAAATTWPELAEDDLVIIPGWKTQSDPDGIDDHLLDRVRAHHDAGGHVASICAGALALARTGILDGHHATTHHDLTDALARHRSVHVEHDVLFTCEPRLHTSAGIASGIDLALHLVAHDHGPALAARVARTLVVPAWRPGTTTQASIMLTHRNHMSDLVHRAQDILDNPDQPPQTLDALAERLGVSGRTLARHFTTATGLTPHAYATAVRHEHARALHDHGFTWQAAAHAVGYADARSLRASKH